jgi:hypothetical protein
VYLGVGVYVTPCVSCPSVCDTERMLSCAHECLTWTSCGQYVGGWGLQRWRLQKRVGGVGVHHAPKVFPVLGDGVGEGQ